MVNRLAVFLCIRSVELVDAIERFAYLSMAHFQFAMAALKHTVERGYSYAEKLIKIVGVNA